MTIFTSTPESSSVTQNDHHLSGYCRDSYQSYKRSIRTIVNSVKSGGETIEMKEFPIPNTGPNDETLSIIAVWRGSKTARRVVIRFSGSLGLGGDIGAAGQFYALETTRGTFHDQAFIEIFGITNRMFTKLQKFHKPNGEKTYRYSSSSATDIHQKELKGQKSLVRRSFSLSLPERDKSKNEISKFVLKEPIHGRENENPDVFINDSEEPLGKGAALLLLWLEENLSFTEKIVCIDSHSEPGKWSEVNMNIHDYNNLTTPSNLNSIFGNTITVKSGEAIIHKNVCSEIYEVAKKANAQVRFIGITQTIGTHPINKIFKEVFGSNFDQSELENLDHFLPRDHKYRQKILKCLYPKDKKWRHLAVINQHELFNKAVDYTHK